ncbi:arginine--tRNA ligase [Candidatus Pacearchaeota archaeon]|nr:arginine--tRNA ligase [Candidatus Pacearchaeota archaeon]
MKEIIAELIAKSSGMKKEEISNLIEIPPTPELGDFSFPCFSLSKKMKKSPNIIAEELKKKIKTGKEIERIETKSGYLNFFTNKKIYSENIISEVLKEKENYGKGNEKKKQKIAVDFSAPNIGKPMHIGHIRSTILGDSILKIFDFQGHEVIGINYLGDIGLHIGKLIVAYELWLDKDSLKKDPVQELLRLYIKFCDQEKTEYQEGLEEEFQDNEWTNKAKEKLLLLEKGDEKTKKIWKEIQDSSKKGFNRVYSLLNVNFHETTGQSLFSEAGKKIITEALKKGKAKLEKDGAVYVEFPDMPKKYILRSNGTSSYITYDIGAAVERFKKYKFDKMIYVTDFRQELHFKQLFEILKLFGYDFYSKLYHIGFGTVNFGNEILATRKGKVILLEDVLKKTIEKAEEEIKKRKTKGDADKIGVAAVKYAFLKNEPRKDVNFSWEQALNFEGNTGPYLQYTYARANSILRKSGKTPKAKISFSLKKEEFELIKKLSEFPEQVRHSSLQLNPSIIANYSFELAQKFNEFYHSSQVINSENEEEKLAIVKAFMFVLKSSLSLLGIEVMEQM